MQDNFLLFMKTDGGERRPTLNLFFFRKREQTMLSEKQLSANCVFVCCWVFLLYFFPLFFIYFFFLGGGGCYQSPDKESM